MVGLFNNEREDLGLLLRKARDGDTKDGSELENAADSFLCVAGIGSMSVNSRTSGRSARAHPSCLIETNKKK